VAPFDLLPVNASISLNLAANSGVVQPWSLGLTANITPQLPPGKTATEVKVAITNFLSSASERGTVSFGSKKDFQLKVATTETRVPETGTTFWLFGTSLGILGAAFAFWSRKAEYGGTVHSSMN
jgi:hypothetical protein